MTRPRACTGSRAHGGPSCAIPKSRQRVKAYRGTVLVARLFHEALLGLPVARALRVEVVGRALLLQSPLGVVLVLKTEAKKVMGTCGVRV